MEQSSGCQECGLSAVAWWCPICDARMCEECNASVHLPPRWAVHTRFPAGQPVGLVGAHVTDDLSVRESAEAADDLYRSNSSFDEDHAEQYDPGGDSSSDASTTSPGRRAFLMATITSIGSKIRSLAQDDADTPSFATARRSPPSVLSPDSDDRNAGTPRPHSRTPPFLFRKPHPDDRRPSLDSGLAYESAHNVRKTISAFEPAPAPAALVGRFMSDAGRVPVISEDSIVFRLDSSDSPRFASLGLASTDSNEFDWDDKEEANGTHTASAVRAPQKDERSRGAGGKGKAHHHAALTSPDKQPLQRGLPPQKKGQQREAAKELRSASQPAVIPPSGRRKSDAALRRTHTNSPLVVPSKTLERTDSWVELCNMVRAENGVLASAMLSCGMADSLNSEYCRRQLLAMFMIMENPFSFLEKLLTVEVAKLNDVNTFLRHESVSVYMLQMLLMTIPKTVMKDTLQEFVIKAAELKEQLNFGTTNKFVDTVRKTTASLMEICAGVEGFQLISYVVYNALYEGLKMNPTAQFSDAAPVSSFSKKELRWQCKKLAVVSVVLLRCIVPAILSPVQMGILLAPDAEKQKSLLCFSKFLMKISATADFEDNSTLSFLNGIVNFGREKVNWLVKKLISRGRKIYYGSEISFESSKGAVDMMAEYVHGNRAKIVSALNESMDHSEAKRIVKMLIRRRTHSRATDLMSRLGKPRRLATKEEDDRVVIMSISPPAL